MACVKECTCPKTECPNNKKCCACIANHRGKGNLPFCMRCTTSSEGQMVTAIYDMEMSSHIHKNQ